MGNWNAGTVSRTYRGLGNNISTYCNSDTRLQFQLQCGGTISIDIAIDRVTAISIAIDRLVAIYIAIYRHIAIGIAIYHHSSIRVVIFRHTAICISISAWSSIVFEISIKVNNTYWSRGPGFYNWHSSGLRLSLPHLVRSGLLCKIDGTVYRQYRFDSSLGSSCCLNHHFLYRYTNDVIMKIRQLCIY